MTALVFPNSPKQRHASEVIRIQNNVTLALLCAVC